MSEISRSDFAREFELSLTEPKLPGERGGGVREMISPFNLKKFDLVRQTIATGLANFGKEVKN